MLPADQAHPSRDSSSQHQQIHRQHRCDHSLRRNHPHKFPGHQPSCKLGIRIRGGGFQAPRASQDVINAYEPNRDILDTKTNQLASTVISRYDYAVNEIGQRTGVTTSGTAFPNLPSWFWGYDSLGQVTRADSSIATNDRSYEYDSIGNRKKTANSLTLPTVDNYTANALNQYSSIQEGGTGVSPVYDDDGNATAYPLPVAPTTNSTLTWDAENRLISSIVGSSTTTYAYDAQSRRIAKTTDSTSTLYLYDAWNCIAEYSGSVGVPPALQKNRLWGLDLSGTLQGAGGVGGLLAESSLITSNPITFNTSYPTYDGNGNVSEYLNSTGQVTAHFEYDPFGNTVVNTDATNQFAYRFSTKPLDLETKLYYYGYRYYDPLTGHWPSRDPIEEMGGINLYGFVGNDGIISSDYLGMIPDLTPGNIEAQGGVSVSGCGIYGPGVGVMVCISGSVSVKVGTSYKGDGTKATLSKMSGTLRVSGGVAAGAYSGITVSPIGQVTIQGEDPCPDPIDDFNFSIDVTSEYGFGTAGCTYTFGGGWSCSAGFQFTKGVSASVGGSGTYEITSVKK